MLCSSCTIMLAFKSTMSLTIEHYIPRIPVYCQRPRPDGLDWDESIRLIFIYVTASDSFA